MTPAFVDLQDVSVTIPIFLPGQQRLLRKPRFLTSVGAPMAETNGKFHVNALMNISFRIETGQNLGLIGHNGAGKSTLLRLIAGIYPPSTGKLSKSGSIGCLFDTGTGATPEMTGREVIKNYIMIRRGLTPGWRDIAEEVADFTDLGPYIDMPIRIYSDGMRSRLMAALATAWHQDVLLIDEGIGAGDAAFLEKFSRRVNDFLNQSQLVVVASHDLGIVKQYSKFGLVLKHGAVAFFGPIAEAIEFYAQNGSQP